MPKRRDCTGILRTPLALAWLIRQKGPKPRGRLEHLEKALAALPAEIARAKTGIAVLDAVIPRHEVRIDPPAIKGEGKDKGVRMQTPSVLP